MAETKKTVDQQVEDLQKQLREALAKNKELTGVAEQLEVLEQERDRLKEVLETSDAPKVITGDFTVQWTKPNDITKTKHKGTFGFKPGRTLIHVSGRLFGVANTAIRVKTELILKLHKGEALSEEEMDEQIKFFINEERKANENVQTLLVDLAQKYTPQSAVLVKIK